MTTENSAADPAEQTITQTDPNPGAGGGEGGAPTEVKKPELVDKSRLDHALDDMHKQKNRANELEKKLEDRDAADLKNSNKYKEYSETLETKVTDANARADRVQNAFIDEKKFGALKEVALKAGIRDVSDLDSVDLDQIKVETTSTGRVNVLGVDTFIENQKMLKPHWFGPKANPNVNTNHVGIIVPNVVTAVDLVKLEREAKKTGDNAKYREAHARYQKQRALSR